MNTLGQKNIAVLLTCHNRKQKTLAFLKSLTQQAAFKNLQVDIYLLDDASADGTAQAVTELYPSINILYGSGNLFWAGGMRTVWTHAAAQKTYDIFLLFNDDVLLLPDCIERLFDTYTSFKGEGTILIGSTLSPTSNKISYGGHVLYKPNRAAYSAVKPDDVKILPCQLANANIFLVDKKAVDKIGLFCERYTHYLADFDYTITAARNGVGVYVAPGYYGYCEDDHGVNWLSGVHSLKTRINYLYSVKGLAYKEYLYYIKKHFPADYKAAVVKLWLKTLFPLIWDKFKSREGK
ncbi:glycosyltransferase family 2 protein [Mucilaginibacter glaciei]|uniref:Glycosyltransferase family 2 protein n=1 Tax=Mucilaginibacter glaciei TaxID=2772109 RepID=A0A926NQ38_9SPHI|nr:glycosyltransferase family 2 protein [Mucilaginibacter glaciei]MBD1393318.1 glycosyltransferase family 2 protein [Mucilaginibacter glaciei]